MLQSIHRPPPWPPTVTRLPVTLAAAAQLRKQGLQTFDGPEIGRDGKNSLDAYDPDDTRVEVMEFTPTKPPCCHPYTASHPKP